MTSKGPGLCEFLTEAELQQYFATFKNDLKIQNVSQLKYVTDEDLQQLGMSRPEIRRLKKYFQKHYPQTYLSKIKKMIMPKKEEPWETIVLPEDIQEKPPIKVSNKHIIPAEAIIVNKELGTGEFGVVQQGVWTNDGERIQVAIKCLSRERMQNNPIEFLKEAVIMHSIDHEHIVRMYGVVLDTNALMLVTELAALRSLLECLKEPSLRSSFPVLSLCHFAIQICDGMQYLEAKRLIHRDLAARNILVFSKNKVKISDFGLSRALGVGKDYYQTNFNVNLKLPIAWCAPESITFLKFTSASDVWAYAVTLWEMFSYGFQPWAALTGQQILEAIDEPNCQRLERPECCPKEYYALMLRCWHHEPNKRPRFADLMRQLPECKPEQVQAIKDSGDERLKRDHLMFRVGNVITVLDKSPAGVANLWKGVLDNGKTGLFNPAMTVAYLGSNLPSNHKPSEFVRGDGKNTYSSKRSRLRPDMISVPQGDVKHTGHVGLDGAYFGDIAFLGGSKYEHVPHQVVAPYKHTDSEDNISSTDRAPLISNSSKALETNGFTNRWTTDHEYHEISDEEKGLDSPKIDKQFDSGPSLLDEMDAVFRTYLTPPGPGPSGPRAESPPPPSPHEDTVNKRNELREAALTNGTHSKHKKKQATVKPISAADEKTLDTAIALANEVAARSMSAQSADPSSPPISPSSHLKNKFSFRGTSSGRCSGRSGSVGSNGTSGSRGTSTSSLLRGCSGAATVSRTEGRTFTDEAASIPDIQTSISTEAKTVYSVLVEGGGVGQSALEGTTPLRLLRSASGGQPLFRPPPRTANQATRLRANTTGSVSSTGTIDKKIGLSENGETEAGSNLLPVPPRDPSSARTLLQGKPRHERKHPLIIPTAMAQALSQHSALTPTAVLLPPSPTTPTSMAPHQPSPPPPPPPIHSLPPDPPVHTPETHEPTYLGLEDDPPLPGGEESFDERIASELDMLDNMGIEDADEPIPEPTPEPEPEPEQPPPVEPLPVEPAKVEPAVADQLAVMTRLLAPKVGEQECLTALGATNNDLHKAIKLARLGCVLSQQSSTLLAAGGSMPTIAQQLTALEANDWDIVRAAADTVTFRSAHRSSLPPTTD